MSSTRTAMYFTQYNLLATPASDDYVICSSGTEVLLKLPQFCVLLARSTSWW